MSEIIEDGFGNAWSITCPECGQDTMQIVRPGKVQCAAETGPCSLPHCWVCGYGHENPGDHWEDDRAKREANCPCVFIGEGEHRRCRVYFHYDCVEVTK